MAGTKRSTESGSPDTVYLMNLQNPTRYPTKIRQTAVRVDQAAVECDTLLCGHKPSLMREKKKRFCGVLQNISVDLR